MNTNTSFEQIKYDYENGTIGRIDALYKIIKRGEKIGCKKSLYLIGEELLGELTSYVESFDPNRRSFPSDPPSQNQVNLIKAWLSE